MITVAIKMLKQGHTDEDRNDMTREIAVTSLFDHDNVVRMIGVVTIGEPMMLCLEYYEQVPRSICYHSAPSWARFLRLGINIFQISPVIFPRSYAHDCVSACLI